MSFGPWVQPPDATLTAEYLPLAGSTRSGTGEDVGMTLPHNVGDRDALAAVILGGNSYFPDPGVWVTGAGVPYSLVNIWPADDPGPEYLGTPTESDIAFTVVWYDNLYMPPTLGGAPPGAIGVEVEAARGDIVTAHLSASVRFHGETSDQDGDVWVPRFIPTTVYVLLPSPTDYADVPYAWTAVGPTGNTGNPWWTSAELAAMDVGLAASNSGDDSFAALELDLDTTRSTVAVAVATKQQVTPEPIPFGGLFQRIDLWSPNWFTTETGEHDGYQPGPLLTYTYRPPRYRWVFRDRPPLRQRQRRDLPVRQRQRSDPHRHRQTGA